MIRAGRLGMARRSTLLKALLALTLLGWVAQGLDWSDRLVYTAGPGSKALEAPGEIAGNWRAQRIEFVLENSAELEDPWPAAARAARDAGAALGVTRRDEGQAGYSWRPGLPRIFLALRLGPLLLAFGFLLLGALFGVTRWWRLLNLAGCPSAWSSTLRLSFLGLFFNLALPGLTGGDLPKAMLAAREHPERRAGALASVVIDRLVGLWVLVLLGTATVWGVGGEFRVLQWPSLAAFGLLSGGLLGVLARAPRRLLRVEHWIERLPQGRRLKKLEEAALFYRGHPGELVGSLLFSLGNHLAVIVAIFVIGRALGDGLDFSNYLGIVPVASLITALPISPAGWGVGEKAYSTLFELMGATAAIGVAISLTFRLCTVLLGLLGGLFLLLPGGAQAKRVALEIDDSRALGD